MPTGEIRSRYFPYQIIADAKGLRWTQGPAKGWQEALWESVTDFYVEPYNPHNPTAPPHYIVCFQDGRKMLFSTEWSDFLPLRRHIAAHSQNAEAARLPSGDIGWARLGTRPIDLPVSFSYSPEVIRAARKRFQRPLFLLLSVFALLIVCAMAAWSIAPELTFSLMIFLLLPMGVIIANRLFRRPKRERQFREAEQRAARGERFEATQEGLNVLAEGEKQTVLWSEILGYDAPVFMNRPDEDTVRIRTVTGKEFSFTALMENAVQFAEILPMYAHDAVPYRRGDNEKQALGGIALRWTGGEEGKGDPVFHRRTRRARKNLIQSWALCLWITFYCGTCLCLFTFDPPYGMLPLLRWSLGVFFVGVISGSIAALIRVTRRYYRDKVILCKDRLEILSGGKTTELPWRDIVQCQSDRSKVYLTLRDEATHALNIFEYAYGNELPDLIREYVEQAKAEAERVAVAASDMAQPEAEMGVWSSDTQQADSQEIVRHIR